MNKITGIVRSLLNSDLFKSSSVYTLSSIFEKAIPFLLIPVLTRYLSTGDYGIVSMFTVLLGLTIPFTGLNTNSAILRNYYKDEINFPVYVTNSFLISIISTSVVLVLFFLFSDFISTYSEFPSDWLFTVVVVAAAQFVINVVLVIWQAEVKPITYGIFKVGLTALNLGLSVTLIVGLGYGWEGRVIGKIVAVALFGFMAVIILWRKGLIIFELSTDYIRHALKYGVPLIPHVLSSFVITMIDRLFITNMVGISETGIYTVGYQIGMIIGVLASSFNKAWTPWLFEKLDEGGKQIKRKIVKFTYAYIVGILGLAFLLALIAPWLMSFFVGESFYGAVYFIVWIALGYAFKGMYYMVTNYIFYIEKTHFLSWMTFIAAAVNVVLNYFLIQSYGAIGAAQATTITYLVQFLITWFYSSRVYEMPWLLK